MIKNYCKVVVFAVLSFVMTATVMSGELVYKTKLTKVKPSNMVAQLGDQGRANKNDLVLTVDSHLAQGREICGTTPEKGHHWKPLTRKDVLQPLKGQSLSKNLNNNGMLGEAESGEYIIPVVFHIFGAVHNCTDNDSKCVTDEIIRDALKRTNEDFSRE